MADAKADWMLPIQKLAYVIQFDREPVESVDLVVGLVLQQQVLGGPPEEYVSSARRALDSSGWFGDGPHSPAAYLSRIRRRRSVSSWLPLRSA